MGQLKQWLKQDWVRIGSDGSIKGPCGTSKDKKNPDRCLPRSKANSLSKSERATTARKKKKAGAKGKTTVANTKAAKVTGLKNGIKDEYAETTMQIIWLRGLADRDALTDTKRKISEHVANKIRDLRLKKETMQQLSAIRYLQDRVTGHNYYMDLADMSSPDLEKLEKRYRSAIDMMILKQEN